MPSIRLETRTIKWGIMTSWDWNLTFVNWGSGLFGGILGGLFTFGGVYLTLRHESDAHRERICNARRSTALAIGTEVQALFKRYSQSIGNYIAELEDNKIVDGFLMVKENYFSIYEGHATAIGEIEDDEIRQGIIEIYTNFKGHLDSLRINNGLLGRNETACS